jgi:hypothetical protein
MFLYLENSQIERPRRKNSPLEKILDSDSSESMCHSDVLSGLLTTHESARFLP